MAKPLEAKTAIVTGASRGIGAGIALDLAKKGANVVVNYVSDRSKAPSEQIAKQIKLLGRKAILSQVDISNLDDHQKLVDDALKISETGKIDILVHNASLGRDASLKETTLDFYNEHMDCNLRGSFFLTQLVLPHIPHGGRIVFLSSITARQAYATQGVYSATKAGMEALARVWAKELGQEHGITVNCVSPGPVATDQWRASADQLLPEMQPIIDATPAAPRVGEVEDIAPVVTWLCTDEARWVTGSVVCANGGICMI